MVQVDSHDTTDLSSIQPTSAEMEAMWLAARAADADEVRYLEHRRSLLMAGIYEEAA